jgi:hypothetical protein
MRREGGLQNAAPDLTMGLDERMHILAAHNAALLRHKMFEPMDDVRIDRANGLCRIGIDNARSRSGMRTVKIATSLRRHSAVVSRAAGRLALGRGGSRAFGLGWRYRDIEAKSASSLTEV